jgi:hypothetical protein
LVLAKKHPCLHSTIGTDSAFGKHVGPHYNAIGDTDYAALRPDAMAKALPELLAAVRIDLTANRNVPHSSPRSLGTGGDIVQDGAVCSGVDPIGSSCRPLTHSALNRSSGSLYE